MKMAPQVRDFVLFCIQRRNTEWPALYDEMCRVAARHLYQNLGYEDLRELGLSLSLNDMESTISIVDTVIWENRDDIECKQVT
jgi:hypothetical protein